MMGYVWQVRFSRRGNEDIRFNSNSSEQDFDAVKAWLSGDITVRMDGRGRILSILRSIADTLGSGSVSPDSARVIASAFLLSSMTGLEFLTGVAPEAIANDSSWNPRRIEQRSRIDHEFTWMLRNDASGNPVRLTIRVAGTIVSRADAEIVVPEQFRTDESFRWQGIAVVFIWVGLVVTMIVISFRRFRAYEIGFRMAAIVGIASALILGFEMSLSLASERGWQFLIPLIMGQLFYGGGLVLTWAVSESVVREAWRDKMVPLDLLVNGHIIHSRIGASIVAGLSLGVAAYALDLGIVNLLTRVVPLAFFSSEDSGLQTFAVGSPGVFVLTHAFYGATFMTAFFVMFLVSWLRRRIRATWMVVAIPVAAVMLSRAGQYDPFWVGPLAVAGSSLVFVVAMVRYDSLAAFLSLMTFTAARQAGLLAVSGADRYQDSALFLGEMFVVLLVSGLAAQFRKNELTDLDDITPAFARHITERERLQHELEIARSVQMSFLPKANPNIPRLDVASRCEPALEVGGDYYDFIPLPDGRWGIAVGDVSGKGTQAAFFMTLTKGFLRALAQISVSPASVVTNVNKHFYENVERGVFISLVYGVFDPAKATMTLARAGHNPVMLHRSATGRAEVVSPTGLALGMDPGPAFERSIQEMSISCSASDVFVFYTDGISEAMNKVKSEYGEERLADSIARFAHGSAQEILDGIFADVEEFVGKAAAHDDKTLVVVKLL